VVGHQQIRISDFTVHPDHFDEIDVTLVRVDLNKVVAMPANVAKVRIENLLRVPK
jgi:hypothetical protein